MKKVIDGALYNTDTATKIGTHSYSNRTDFRYTCETLYRTKARKYFLHGEGGPMSKYARTIGQNQWAGGEHIEPLSAAKAREWAKEYLDADEYIAEFGEPEEAAEGRETLSTSISGDTKRKLERLSAETGMSIGQLIDNWMSSR